MSDCNSEMKVNSRIKVAEYTIRTIRGCKLLLEGMDDEFDGWIKDLQTGIETLKIEPVEENFESLAYMIRRYKALSIERLEEQYVSLR